MKRAHSLVEVLVATFLAGIALSTIYLVRINPAGSSTESATTGAHMSSDLQMRLQEIVLEIQQGTRVFYPLPGNGDHEGLGLVNIRGEAILFYTQRMSDTGVTCLYRVNLTQVQREGAKPDQPLVDHIHRFRVNVAAAEPGKEASLVNIDLAVESPGREAGKPQVLDFVTSVFLRNLACDTPDDLFAPGTPLTKLR